MPTLYILLVEDDSDDIELLEAAFQSSHIPVHLETIRQGDALVPRLRALTRLPDVIVLDLNLPRMEGTEALQLLKASGDFKHIPVAILTTSITETDRTFCMDAGADVYLNKPSSIVGFRVVTEAIAGLVKG